MLCRASFLPLPLESESRLFPLCRWEIGQSSKTAAWGGGTSRQWLAGLGRDKGTLVSHSAWQLAVSAPVLLPLSSKPGQ